MQETHLTLRASMTIQAGMCPLHRLSASGYCLQSTGKDREGVFQAGAPCRRRPFGQQRQLFKVSTQNGEMDCHCGPKQAGAPPVPSNRQLRPSERRKSSSIPDSPISNYRRATGKVLRLPRPGLQNLLWTRESSRSRGSCSTARAAGMLICCKAHG
jgi:hypothetical protein